MAEPGIIVGGPGVQPDPLAAHLVAWAAELQERIDTGQIDLAEWELDRG